MSQLQTEFSAMVSDLAKPGETIQGELSPNDCHLIHMTMGIVGEFLSELPLATDAENFREEFGDIEFYLEGILQAYNFTWDDLPQLTMEEIQIPAPDMGAPQHLGVLLGELVDCVKRHTIMRKIPDMPKIINILATTRFALDHIYATFDEIENRDEVLNQNMEKLLKGEKARYATGKYSDEQAIARADKVGTAEEEVVSETKQ